MNCALREELLRNDQKGTHRVPTFFNALRPEPAPSLSKELLPGASSQWNNFFTHANVNSI